MTETEANVIVSRIDYPAYRFSIGRYEDGNMYLQGVYLEQDIDSPIRQAVKQHTRKWVISPHMTASELVQTVLKCVLTSAEHRVREHFTYRGERIFGPHFDVEALVTLCKDGHLEHRKSIPESVGG